MTATSLMRDLRTSLEAGTVTWALIQADYALQGRPLPAKIADVHHGERRKYEDAALVALRGLNRDAELYAERSATFAAFDTFEQFCKDRGLDWLEDTNVINEDDELETLIARCATKAVQRFRQVLTGVYPGLSEYLARMDQRATNGDPALAREEE